MARILFENFTDDSGTKSTASQKRRSGRSARRRAREEA